MRGRQITGGGAGISTKRSQWQCREWGPSIPRQSSPTSHQRQHFSERGWIHSTWAPFQEMGETGFLSLPHLTFPGV